jgi:uncharacterized ion transporter superfamily protein YfcC
MKLKLPNTFVLLFAILAVIAAATWLVPGGSTTPSWSTAKRVSIRPPSTMWPAPRRASWR